MFIKRRRQQYDKLGKAGLQASSSQKKEEEDHLHLKWIIPLPSKLKKIAMLKFDI